MGRIGSPYGIKGWVHVQSFTDPPEQLLKYRDWLVHGARADAARLGVPFLGEVPLTIEIRETSDAGRPMVATEPKSPAAAAYREIAARALAELGRAKGAARPAPQIVMES